MALSVKHAKVAATLDSGDGKVSSNAWNDSHVLAGSPNVLIGTDGTGSGVEVSIGSGLAYSGGALTNVGAAAGLQAVANRTTLAAITGQTAGATRYMFESGREGSFVFDSANHSTHVTNDPNQGIYVAPASDTTGASGAWVRKFSGSTNVKWFGAAGDGVTNDAASIIAAIAFLKSIAGNLINTWYKASGKLLLPQGQYYCGTTTIDITHTLTIEGEGGAGFAGGGGTATMLKWDDGATGIRIQDYNTSGVSTVDSSPFHFTGAYTTLRGMYLRGGYSGTEGEYHGIRAKARIILDDVQVDNFSGDGLYAHTSVGGGSPTEGNSNCSRVYNSHFSGCRNGVSLTGGDANAWLFSACFFDFNRSWGVNDTSFLGNTYIGCHEDSNGIIPNAVVGGASVVSNGTNRYAVVYGQEANASVTAPTGTVDTAYWYYMAAGVANTSSLYIPNWSSGMTLRAGGPMLLYNGNQNSLVSGNYSEGGQGPIQQTVLGIVQGGSNNAGVKGGCWNRGFTGGYYRQTKTQILGALQVLQDGGVGGSIIVDGAADPNFTTNPSITVKTGIATTGNSTLNFNKSDDTLMGKLQCIANFGLLADGVLGVWLRYNGADIANINSTGLNVASGKNFQMNGTVTFNTSGILQAAAFPAQTGDVTNTQGSLANTIAAGAVSLSKMANLAANSIIGNSTGSPATPTALTTLPTSVVPAFTGDVTNSAGSLAMTIPANTITYAKFQQVAASSLVGNATGSTANATGITIGGGLFFTGSQLVGAVEHPGYISGNWYCPINSATAIGGAAIPSGSIRLMPFMVSKPITVSQLAARVSTVSAASNFQLALYANNAATGRPTGAALCSTANMSCASLAAVSATVTNVLLAPGTYWMAINQDNATAAYTTISGAEAQMAYMVGSATLASVVSTGAGLNLIVTVTQTFGTWPDLTSASFAESNTNTSALLFLKAA